MSPFSKAQYNLLSCDNFINSWFSHLHIILCSSTVKFYPWNAEISVVPSEAEEQRKVLCPICLKKIQMPKGQFKMSEFNIHVSVMQARKKSEFSPGDS